MKLHRNAKTTPPMRQLIIHRVRQQGWTQSAVADALGISVRTLAKWLQRARTGDTALADGSSRPRRLPRQLSVATTAAIVACRDRRATALTISTALGVRRSSVARVLRRAGSTA
jgi:transposase